ncbi:MAG: nucleotidyltransferase domain-containing protein [Candidatus Latescibacterota bacterium]
MEQVITDTKMREYRAAAVRRDREALRRRATRWERAQRVAGEAAGVLRAEFGATRVVLFGSGTSADRFRLRSDLDLAVWGLPERLYLRAVARLLSIDPDVPVDLVMAEDAGPSVRAAIAAEGRDQ